MKIAHMSNVQKPKPSIREIYHQMYASILEGGILLPVVCSERQRKEFSQDPGKFHEIKGFEEDYILGTSAG
jgi:hypothetical protein